MTFTMFVLLATFCALSNCKSLQNEEETNVIPDLGFEDQSFLTKLITNIFEASDLKQVLADVKAAKTSESTCHSCKFGIALLQHLRQFGVGKKEIGKIAISICTALRIESPRVCHGVVEAFRVSFNPL